MKTTWAAIHRSWSQVQPFAQRSEGRPHVLKKRITPVLDQLAVVVFVNHKIPKEELVAQELIPHKIGTLETDVIEIGEVHIVYFRTVRTRPALQGVSIGHHKITAGTFGALVKDARTRASHLVNNHIQPTHQWP